MLKILNKALSYLPFNGKKSLVGLILSLIAIVFPDFPLEESHINGVINAFHSITEFLGPIYLVIGLLHKWIKAKAR